MKVVSAPRIQNYCHKSMLAHAKIEIKRDEELTKNNAIRTVRPVFITLVIKEREREREAQGGGYM